LNLSNGSGSAITEHQTFMGNDVSTYVLKNTDGSIQEMGATLPLALITNAPTSLPEGANPEMPDPAHVLHMGFGTGAATTFIDHLEIDYNPVGHPPQGVYTVPHFDVHFYGIPLTKQLAIDCNDQTLVVADHLPQNFMLGKAGPPPAGDCVPQMGLHAIDLTSPEWDRTNPMPFSKTMILGYYGGDFIFVEPMITREQLLKKEDFSLPITLPSVTGHLSNFPTMFRAMFDAPSQSYRLALTDFVKIQK
jgi:hypothetical protein